MHFKLLVSISDYLILPAVLLVFRMPLLYRYGCVLGSFVVAISMLNIAALGFLHQTADAVPFHKSWLASLKPSHSQL